MTQFEVKLVQKFDLSGDDREFIREKVDEIAQECQMELHPDLVTYSRKQPCALPVEIHSGVKFYFKMKQLERYFTLLEYYSYSEGDINGRVIRNRGGC